MVTRGMATLDAGQKRRFSWPFRTWLASDHDHWVELKRGYSKDKSMTYTLNPRQYEAVLALGCDKRCEHFVSKVADNEQLWVARNPEGWLMPLTPQGLQYCPVWPHRDYAQNIVDEHFPGHQAVVLPLDRFMAQWLPNFERNKVKVAIFPNKAWEFQLMEPDDLLSCLKQEMTLYE